MSQHAEVEAKAAAELDSLGLLATPQRPRPRAMVYEDLARLQYLSWVVKVPPCICAARLFLALLVASPTAEACAVTVLAFVAHEETSLT